MKLLKVEALSEEAQYLRLLDYGEPGSGKTWFGASAALDELTAPCFFIDYRSQIASLRSNTEYMEAMNDGRLVIVTLDEYADLNHIYAYLFQQANLEPKTPRPTGGLWDLFPEGPPKTVVVDSTTEIQRAEVMRIAGNPAGKFIRDVERPQIQHWGSLLNQFTLLAHLFYQLPYHIVFSGLEAVDYGKKENLGEPDRPVGFRLAMQGAAQRQFPAYALTVMRLSRAPRSAAYYAVGETQGIAAKTKEQTGMFPATIGNPTIPGLVKLLQGEGND